MVGKKNPPPDERVIFLALKHVFKGPDAGVRQNKAIRKLIKQHQDQENVADIVREHNLEVVCNSARTLLCDEIFESTLKAKIRFPELFDLSPTQSAEKEASEAEAARHEADTIALAVHGHLDSSKTGASQGVALDAKAEDVPRDLLLSSTAIERPNDPQIAASITSISPLFPVYLPFQAQHSLLVHLQKLLEGICYDFGKRAIPEILQNRGWDCAESVELNRWTEEFLKIEQKFLAFEHVKKPLQELFRSVANIRHTAVHRLRVSAKGIEQFLHDAEALAVLLDAKETEQVAKLRRETQITIEELQRNRLFLRSRLEDTLRGLAVQHEELKRLEGIAIAEMEREDKEYQILAGKSVDEAIAPSEASFSTAIDTERETVTGFYDTDDIDEDDDDDLEQPQEVWERKSSSNGVQ